MRERLDALVDEMLEKGLLHEEACREFERRYISRALTRDDASLSAVAARLGMHRNTLRRKMTSHRLAYK